VRGGGGDCRSLKGAQWGKEGGLVHSAGWRKGWGTRRHGRDAWRRGPSADGVWSGGRWGRPAAAGAGRVAQRMGAEEEGGGVRAYGSRSASVGRPEGIVSFVNYSKIFKQV
jgi:hypothetical protein